MVLYEIGGPISGFDPSFVWWGQGRLFGQVPIPVIVFLAFAQSATADPAGPVARHGKAHKNGPWTIEETADVMEISPATVKRDWATAKLWLYNELKGDDEAG